MKKLFAQAYAEAKALPKGLWIAAAVVPGGMVTIAAYLAGKSAYEKFIKKEDKDEKKSSDLS